MARSRRSLLRFAEPEEPWARSAQKPSAGFRNITVTQTRKREFESYAWWWWWWWGGVGRGCGHEIDNDVSVDIESRKNAAQHGSPPRPTTVGHQRLKKKSRQAGTQRRCGRSAKNGGKTAFPRGKGEEEEVVVVVQMVNDTASLSWRVRAMHLIGWQNTWEQAPGVPATPSPP